MALSLQRVPEVPQRGDARTPAHSSLILMAFVRILAPMVSNLYNRGRLEVLGIFYRDVSRWTFIGSVTFLPPCYWQGCADLRAQIRSRVGGTGDHCRGPALQLFGRTYGTFPGDDWLPAADPAGHAKLGPCQRPHWNGATVHLWDARGRVGQRRVHSLGKRNNPLLVNRRSIL